MRFLIWPPVSSATTGGCKTAPLHNADVINIKSSTLQVLTEPSSATRYLTPSQRCCCCRQGFAPASASPSPTACCSATVIIVFAIPAASTLLLSPKLAAFLLLPFPSSLQRFSTELYGVSVFSGIVKRSWLSSIHAFT
jgi:hypothetical protein